LSGQRCAICQPGLCALRLSTLGCLFAFWRGFSPTPAIPCRVRGRPGNAVRFASPDCALCVFPPVGASLPSGEVFLSNARYPMHVGFGVAGQRRAICQPGMCVLRLSTLHGRLIALRRGFGHNTHSQHTTHSTQNTQNTQYTPQTVRFVKGCRVGCGGVRTAVICCGM